MKHHLIALGIFGTVAGIIILVRRRMKYSGHTDYFNMDALVLNLGSGAKANSQGIIAVKFNSNKNTAQFYNNNRVVIFDASGKVLVKGSYSDGGKTLNMDGGKQVSSGSVWNNLLNAIK